MLDTEYTGDEDGDNKGGAKEKKRKEKPTKRQGLWNIGMRRRRLVISSADAVFCLR